MEPLPLASNEFSICISAIDSEQKAREIGAQAVKARLASGVTIIPSGHSVYRWKGDVENADESVMLFYTRSSLAEALGTLVKELHPYEVCPFISIRTGSTLPEFLEWIGSNTASDVEDY